MKIIDLEVSDNQYGRPHRSDIWASLCFLFSDRTGQNFTYLFWHNTTRSFLLLSRLLIWSRTLYMRTVCLYVETGWKNWWNWMMSRGNRCSREKAQGLAFIFYSVANSTLSCQVWY